MRFYFSSFFLLPTSFINYPLFAAWQCLFFFLRPTFAARFSFNGETYQLLLSRSREFFARPGYRLVPFCSSCASIHHAGEYFVRLFEQTSATLCYRVRCCPERVTYFPWLLQQLIENFSFPKIHHSGEIIYAVRKKWRYSVHSEILCTYICRIISDQFLNSILHKMGEITIGIILQCLITPYSS